MTATRVCYEFIKTRYSNVTLSSDYCGKAQSKWLVIFLKKVPLLYHARKDLHS